MVVVGFVTSLMMVVYVTSAFAVFAIGIKIIDVNLVDDMKLRCPRCGSGECYYRFKTNDIVCRRCGRRTNMEDVGNIIKERNKPYISERELKKIEEIQEGTKE